MKSNKIVIVAGILLLVALALDIIAMQRKAKALSH